MDCPVELQLEVAFNTASVPKVSSAENNCVFSVELSTGAKGVPHIFSPPGGRSQDCIAIDRRLHGASSVNDFFNVLGKWASQFDAGNSVVAFSQAAKLVDEGQVAKLEGNPCWDALLTQLSRCAKVLEPRGLSMVAYDFAKLSCVGDSLLITLAREGVRCANQFGAKDIAKMCWAIAKYGLLDPILSFWEAMEMMVPEKVQSGNVADISMIAWSFATMEVGSASMYHEIGKAVLGMISELPPQSLSNIIWAYATVGLYDDYLVSSVCARAESIVTDFVEFDMSDLCWGLAKMRAVNYVLFDRLASHIVESKMWKRFPAMHASQVAWAFASARFYHPAFFDAMSEYFSKHVAVFDPQHVAMFVWAAAAVGYSAPVAFEALANHAKGGKLWNFLPDQLCAIFWSFVKIGWRGEQLFWDLVRVTVERRNEFDGDCIANLIWSLASLQTGPVDTSEFDVEIQTVLDFALDMVLSGNVFFSDPDSLSMAIWAFCKLERLHDARMLFECLVINKSYENLPSHPTFVMFAQSYSMLVLEAERLHDVELEAYLWILMGAQATESTCRAAFLHCAMLALRKGGRIFEARQVYCKLEELKLDNALSRRLALSLDSCENGNDIRKSSLLDTASFYWFPLDVTSVEYCNGISLLRTLFSDCSTHCCVDQQFLVALLSQFERQCDGVSAGSAGILKEAINKCRPSIIVDVHAKSGFSTLRMAIEMQCLGVEIYHMFAIEEDPLQAAILRNLCEMANVGHAVTCFVGPSCEVLPSLPTLLGGCAVGMVLLHNASEARLLADYEILEDMQIVDRSSMILVDRALLPGTPKLLWRVFSSGRPCRFAELIEVEGADPRKSLNWTLLCEAECLWGIRSHFFSMDGFPELPSLSAESVYWSSKWATQRNDSAGICSGAELFSKRFRTAFANRDILPTRGWK